MIDITSHDFSGMILNSRTNGISYNLLSDLDVNQVHDNYKSAQ
ncbi:hypothetical protein [Acidaminobacter sp. JC074]|nr:hypothetical protein [Acidaminobacter sp. JC074]